MEVDEEIKVEKKWSTARKIDKKSHFIWTIELGAQNERNLVMVHGYGGSGMIFYKMFRRLSEHFHVYLIDILGMGRSSRNTFNCKTFEEWEQYFVKSIEKWRDIMKIDKMNLLGHSFGGYVVSRYALYYPERIEKLLFLSPFASESSSPEHAEEFENRLKNAKWFKRQVMKLAVWMYKKNTTPFGVARKAGRLLGGYAIKKGLKRRLDKVPKEEFPALSDYMHQIIMAKGSSEYAFNIMFPNFMITDKAIMNNLQTYKDNGIGNINKILLYLDYWFFYGTRDWMDTNLNKDFVSDQLKSKDEKVYMIKKAGHHVGLCLNL